MVRKKPTDKKLNALKKHSALNRQPQRVRDELFDQDDFFDAWDLVQVKYEMLRKVQVDKKTVSDVTADFGFSRPSWNKRTSCVTVRWSGLARRPS